MSTRKYHYHLVSGLVAFKGADDRFGEVTVNAVIHSPDGNIGSAEMTLARVTLQTNFHNQFEGQDLEVVGVYLYGISNMGKMTRERYSEGNRQTTEQVLRTAMASNPDA